MKKCTCGNTVPSNTRVCPRCGKPLTHPFGTALAWLIGVLIILSIVMALISRSERPIPKAISTLKPPSETFVKATEDEADVVIQLCGKPDHDFMENVPGATVRHLVYSEFNTELIFYHGTNMAEWRLGKAVVPKKNEAITMEEANRGMPCAKGQLHSFLESR